jgi:hypothetical protein
MPRGVLLMKRSLIAGWITLMACGGCASLQTKVISKKAYPDPAYQPRVEEEEREVTQASAEVAGRKIVVEAMQVTECREVTTRRMLARERSDSSLTSGGSTTQTWLGVGAGTLGLAGILGLASSCPPVTGMASDGTRYQNACLPADEDKESTAHAAGYVALSGAAVLGGVLLVNALSTGESTRVVKADALKKTSEWEECESGPLVDASLEFALPDGTVVGGAVTDDEGAATLSLRAIDPDAQLAEKAFLYIVHGHDEIGRVDISATTLYANSERLQRKHEKGLAAKRAEESKRRAEARRGRERSARTASCMTAFRGSLYDRPSWVTAADLQMSWSCAAESGKGLKRAGACKRKHREKICELHAKLVDAGEEENLLPLLRQTLAKQVRVLPKSPKQLRLARRAVRDQLEIKDVKRERVVLGCPGSGALTMHEMKIQNRFGAWQRGVVCTFVIGDTAVVLPECHPFSRKAIEGYQQRRADWVESAALSCQGSFNDAKVMLRRRGQ